MIPIPLPSELEGKDLIGSRWVRRMGKHRGVVGTIVSFNDAGCKLEIRGRNQNQSHLGDKRFGSVQWPMLMNLYALEGKLSDMIVTVDKNDFVIAAHKEGTLPELPLPFVIQEGIVEEEEMVMPVVETRLCVGPWHRKAGKGTEIPITKFGRITRGPHAGELAKTCVDCLAKRKHDYISPAEYKARKATVNGAFVADQVKTPEPSVAVELPPASAPVSTGRYQWKVTVLKPVVVTVWADDFLSAGVAAGDGEIFKIERT